jgi:hypothetical protein
VETGERTDDMNQSARWRWLNANLRPLLDGYAAALDEVARLRHELGDATAHEGDWLSKTSRLMCETVMGDRDALRAEVARLRAELAKRLEPTG